MPNGQNKITGVPFDTEFYESEHKITDPELTVRKNTTH